MPSPTSIGRPKIVGATLGITTPPKEAIMSQQIVPLAPAERAALSASLERILDRLDQAGEPLVAVHVHQAIACLALEVPATP
jgi:hypothetical protein